MSLPVSEGVTFEGIPRSWPNSVQLRVRLSRSAGFVNSPEVTARVLDIRVLRL